MPRKPNYGFDKRRKEQDRKAKKDAKLLDKQRRREEEANASNPTDAPADSDASLPRGTDES
jgi:hypothetical protein